MKLRDLVASAAIITALWCVSATFVRVTSANGAPLPNGMGPLQAAASSSATAQSFAGKIVSQNGVRYILRDEQGNTWYHLDDQQEAGKFLGKIVNVTGTLDGRSDMIHVSSIAETKT
jgi:streptogramin lyase